jgi:hypothetical protein
LKFKLDKEGFFEYQDDGSLEPTSFLVIRICTSLLKSPNKSQIWEKRQLEEALKGHGLKRRFPRFKL